MSIRKVLLAASVAALLPLAAMAQGGGGHWHRGHGGDLAFLAGVQLTDAQKEQVHQLMHTSFTQIKPLIDQLRSLRQQIGDQMASTGSVDQAQLTPLVQQLEQVRDQIDQQRVETALQVRALLTSEQLAQAAQAHQQLQSLHAQIKSVLSQGKSAPSAQ
ncbi:MAG TPA: periplasmic heavy metal sensor [Stellaceae bacterium]|nr:periplasmic heavy metal sensor [Stellaceae bacterium]